MTTASASGRDRSHDDVDPDLALARAIAGATVELDDVDHLSAGPVGVHATWRRGQRCPGVRIDRADPPRVEIQVVATRPEAVAGLGERVRSRLRDRFGARIGPIDVHVSDVLVDDDQPAEATAALGSRATDD